MVGTIKRAFYDSPSGQILYRYILTTKDAKRAPVVFMHQSPSCGRCYELIMKEYAERGHDCYAPDMPGFGESDDIDFMPESTRFYVDTLMGLYRHLKLPKMHLVGHHTGSAMAMEMGAIYPDEILTVCCSAPALASREEQKALYAALHEEWSKPKADGSQLMRVWDIMKDYVIGDLETKVYEVLAACRSWKGRKQAYEVLFRQDKLTFFKQITCPLIAMCAEDDVVWPNFHYVQELQPNARREVTSGDIFGSKNVEGTIAFYHVDFLDKMGA
ncbi:hypothetical protein BP5796_12364 [Coleophoma crateriformis]|uniref:Serine aminopeptidase S33 domain-containing protein n=1 Tax=Coleophoma crateriformis TaxID=565419 RepID=A0A3D8QAE2_9HELO|nr:hypothetical protein BP5796_12364 [Coleophoma crateriformis]